MIRRTRRPLPRVLPRALTAGLLAAGLLTTTGCGAEVEPAAKNPSGAVTVSNCGRKVTYPRPQRPVAYDVSGAEKMFALGLADRMRGYVMNELGDPSIEGSPWRKDYAKVERLGTARITREIVVDAKADWVLAGWNSGFSEERGITPDAAEEGRYPQPTCTRRPAGTTATRAST